MKVFPAASLILASLVGISLSRSPTSNDNCPLVSCGVIGCTDGSECRFGSELPRCGCCPVCLKGLGEPCGGPFQSLGTCGPRLRCVDSTGQEVAPFQDASFQAGTCTDRDPSGSGMGLPAGNNGCPLFCAAVSTDGSQCQFGSELDLLCGCFPVCLKGFGEECAGPFQTQGKCGPSLGCVDSTGQVIPPFVIFDIPVGICSDRDANGNGFPAADGCPLSCAAVSCSNGFECQFGVGPSRCGCCPSCLRGPGEPCAGPFLFEGFCAEGLVCLDPFLNEITPVKEPGVPVGDCDQRRTPVDPLMEECSLNCALVRCAGPESLNCKLGVGTGLCGCCPACLRGPGEPCGGAENEEGSCAYGLTCVDPYSGQPAGDQVGVCQPTRPGNRRSGGGESRITKGIFIGHYPSLDTSDEDDVSRPHYA